MSAVVAHLLQFSIFMTELNRDRATSYSWEWPAVVGVLLMVMGATVIGAPVLATIGVSWLMGLSFVISGVAQLIHALRFTKSRGWVSRYLLASLSLVAGFITLRNPIAGAVGITLVLSFYLLLSSVARGTLAIEAKGINGRGWLTFSSVVSFCLGIYLLFNLGVNSLIVPGTLLGVDLIFYGVSLTFIAGTFRRGGLSYAEAEIRRAA